MITYGHTTNRTLDELFEEATNGNHVAHITKGNRIVALRPARIESIVSTHNKFNLDFQDADFDLRPDGNTLYNLTEAKARKAIRTFFVGVRRQTSHGLIYLHINQAERECEILKTTPSRIRIEYELPNSGLVQAWRNKVDIGTRRYINNYA